MKRCLAFYLVCASFCAVANADEPPTFLTERGKLRVREDFSADLSKDFKAGKGKWSIVDGALQGSEVKSDEHAATYRRPLAIQNAVIQYDFRLEGGKTTFSINGTKGHLSRLLITPTTISLKKDSSDKNKTDKAALLDTAKVEVKSGTWHTVVLEQFGKEMAASLDGKLVALGKHEGIDRPIGNVGFTVSGGAVSFRNLRIYEASPNPMWPNLREKQLQSRTK